MANNITITQGVGTTAATDDCAGVHYGLMKLADGTEDSTTRVGVADIGVKANAIRVCPSSDITDATYIGDIKFGEAEPNSAAILADTTAILADTAAIQTAVELLDNAVDGNYLNVNLNAAGVDLSMNAGVLTAQTQRVTIATDDEVNNLLGTIDADTSSMATDLGTIAADTTSIDGKITACNTGAVVLAAGSAAFGKLAANSGVDIGDVDVTSMPPNTTASGTLTAAAQTVSVTPPNGCSAISLQVTGTWVGQIEFEGTVDGTNYQSVEASNGTQTVNATTTNDIFLLPGAGYLTIRVRASSWTSGTANINFIATIGTTSAILTGSLPAGANAIGKLTANSGVDIGDVDVTSCDGIAAEAAALGNGILIQGDDGTDRKNINVDATTGDIQVDVTNTITETNSATIAGDTTSIDGKITACNTGAVTISAALPAGDNNIGNVDIASSVALDVSAATVTVDLGANNDVVAAGDVAHDAADSGNPIKIGFKAYNHDGTVPGTAVAELDRANGICDVYGRQYVSTDHPYFFNSGTKTYGAAQTNTTVQAAPGAGLSLYITDIVISNGATAGIITLLDGSGGTEKAGGYFAANGGMVWNLKTPIKLTANTLLAITSTTVTTHKVTVNGYIAP